MFRPFGGKHLSEVDLHDLEALIQDEVPEGLFIEYKSEWSSQKVARTVASFANSQRGGWLIVGMSADGLLPKEIVGIKNSGDLEERVVSTVRSSITPVPAFFPRALEVESGTAALIVQVPEGTQPPYILVRTGQILVRTPASSEPVGINDREALDRLFISGERGRVWAQTIADGLRTSARDQLAAQVWTVPAVDNGLAAIPAIFVRSFAQAVVDQMKTFTWVSSVFLEHKVQPGMGEDLITVTIPTVENGSSSLAMHVRASGIIRSIWTRPRNGSDPSALKALLEWALPSHGRLYEMKLGHRGDVAIALSAYWMDADESQGLAFVSHPPVQLEELNGAALQGSLGRSIDRSQGYYTSEPETQ